MEGDMVVRKYEGYSGRMICGTLLERWGGVCMRDGPPPRNRPGRAAVFWTSPPPANKGGETGTANDLRAEKKRMPILYLTC